MQPLDVLFNLLSQKAFDYIDEAVCQQQIGKYLTSFGVVFEPEKVLVGFGRIDFFFPRSGLGLEVKANKQWCKREVFRQMERYAECDSITGLLLATGKMQGLPDTLRGKPARILSLGAAHL